MEKTIYDVARLAGVSTATVSRVINKIGNVSSKTEEKVRLAMEKLDYVPSALAQGFASNKSKTIGLVMNLPLYTDSPENVELIASFFFTELFRGVNSVLRRKGYYLMIINEEKDLTGIVKNFLDQKRIDGLIIGFMPFDIDELKKAVIKERPLVYIGNIHGYKRGLHVYAQYVEYLNDILVYLKEKGHRHIAFLLSRSREYLENEWTKLDLDGYMDLDVEYISYGNKFSFIDDIKKLFVMDDRPTAIFIEDIGAIQPIISILGNLGLYVPEDVSIMSVEHIKGMGENYYPRISNIYVPVYEMGKSAISLLLDYVDGVSGDYNCQVNLLPALIERDSVITLK